MKINLLCKFVSDKKLFEGDIKLDPDESGSTNAFASSIGRLWPNKVIPFEFMGLSKKSLFSVL